MPLPLSTLTMEAIAVIVDKWRRSELTAKQALDRINKLSISEPVGPAENESDNESES